MNKTIPVVIIHGITTSADSTNFLAKTLRDETHR